MQKNSVFLDIKKQGLYTVYSRDFFWRGEISKATLFGIQTIQETVGWSVEIRLDAQVLLVSII